MQFVYKLFLPKWRILTMKTLAYKLRRLSIYSFDQITSLLFSLSSHVLFTMCWPCAFICWWCCNLLTSNQDLWLVRDQMYRDPCRTEQNMFHPKVCIMHDTEYIALLTLYFLLYDTSIMILALPCNRDLRLPYCILKYTHACKFNNTWSKSASYNYNHYNNNHYNNSWWRSSRDTNDCTTGVCSSTFCRENDIRVVSIQL